MHLQRGELSDCHFNKNWKGMVLQHIWHFNHPPFSHRYGPLLCLHYVLPVKFRIAFSLSNDQRMIMSVLEHETKSICITAMGQEAGFLSPGFFSEVLFPHMHCRHLWFFGYLFPMRLSRPLEYWTVRSIFLIGTCPSRWLNSLKSVTDLKPSNPFFLPQIENIGGCGESWCSSTVYYCHELVFDNLYRVFYWASKSCSCPSFFD